jgi:hypothetical protein
MKRTIAALLTVALFLIAAHRLPAPIQELPESPTPTAEPSVKPKVKASKGETTPSQETRTPSRAARATPSPKPTVAQSKGARFAGTWVGTMPEVPWGNVATELIVDETGTTMQWQESGKQKGTEKARLSGDTLQATFQVGVAAIWSLTPQPDGATARVRLQAFMNDQTAVFHRVAGSSAAKTAR